MGIEAVESPSGHWVHIAEFDGLYWRTPCHLYLDVITLKSIKDVTCPRCLSHQVKKIPKKVALP